MRSPKILTRVSSPAGAIFLAFAIAVANSPGLGAAEPCTQDSVAERPGQWSERPADLVFAGQVASPARQGRHA